MHQYVDKNFFFLFLLLIFLFLTSTNSQQFVKKKEAFFNLSSIEVIGLEKSVNLQIEKNLNFLKNVNIFFIDKEIIKDQIEKYNFIENYNIKKHYPSKIILKLKKTVFLAQTLKDNKVFIIGSNGKFIDGKKFNNYQDLPMVFGKFTAENFLIFKKVLNHSGYKYNDIKEIFFFPSGRIDIKNQNDVIIKLPIQNVNDALNIAKKVMNNEKFKRNVIDLRVPNQLILSNE